MRVSKIGDGIFYPVIPRIHDSIISCNRTRTNASHFCKFLIRMSLFFDQGFSIWRTLFISTTSNCHIFFCLFLNFLFKFFYNSNSLYSVKISTTSPSVGLVESHGRIFDSKIALNMYPRYGLEYLPHTQQSERRLAHSHFGNLVLLKWTPLLNNDLLSGYDGMKSRFRTPSIRCKG